MRSQALAHVALVGWLLSGCTSSGGSPTAPSTPEPPPAPTTGSLAGQVVRDTNGNGQRDAGESYLMAPGLGCQDGVEVDGIVISWSGPAGGTTTVNRCDSRGPHFLAGNLPVGDYSVTATLPPGWQLVASAAGVARVSAARSVLVTGGAEAQHTFYARPPEEPPPPPPPPAPAPAPVTLRRTTFQGASGYTTRGAAAIVQTGDQYEVVLNEDFMTSQSSALDVRLCTDGFCNSRELRLGDLKAFSGRQTYPLPNAAADFTHLVIWCHAVNLPFGYGELR